VATFFGHPVDFAVRDEQWSQIVYYIIEKKLFLLVYAFQFLPIFVVMDLCGLLPVN